MIMERNQKIIGIIVLIIGVIAICSSILFMDMNKAEIIIPEEYTLESNNSGVATYKNNLDNGYKLEIKEDSNPNGIKKENMYGSIMKCRVDDKNYIITCYNPVDESKDASPSSTVVDTSNIKAHPWVKPVECVSVGDEATFPTIMKQNNNPYDLKTLNNMNKTGKLNASSIEQYFPPTYMDACKELKELEDGYLLQRYYGL